MCRGGGRCKCKRYNHSHHHSHHHVYYTNPRYNTSEVVPKYRSTEAPMEVYELTYQPGSRPTCTSRTERPTYQPTQPCHKRGRKRGERAAYALPCHKTYGASLGRKKVKVCVCVCVSGVLLALHIHTSILGVCSLELVTKRPFRIFPPPSQSSHLYLFPWINSSSTSSNTTC